MSELKICPFCGKTLIADGAKFFVHPVVGCLLDGIPIKNDAESIKRWNTRKPMQNIVERLKRIKVYSFQGQLPDGRICHFPDAIEIVKEEGGKDE